MGFQLRFQPVGLTGRRVEPTRYRSRSGEAGLAAAGASESEINSGRLERFSLGRNC
jgi:hypothetical protein